MTHKLTDRVVDLDGREGTVVKVTEHGGSRWYDVRFGPQGAAVRFESELKPSTKPRVMLRCDEDAPMVSAKRDISKFCA